MGYPVYKLLRAVNRQYPNNGYINYVEVTEELTNGLIDEDLRDLINEALNETYIHIAKDEVYTFPTVAGQREYVLPEDCDLRDIQEVVRRGTRIPPPMHEPPLPTTYTLYFDSNEGTGVMEPLECNIGEKITLPECDFEPPEDCTFKAWEINGVEYQPGDEVELQSDLIATAVWEEESPDPEYDEP